MMDAGSSVYLCVSRLTRNPPLVLDEALLTGIAICKKCEARLGGTTIMTSVTTDSIKEVWSFKEAKEVFDLSCVFDRPMS